MWSTTPRRSRSPQILTPVGSGPAASHSASSPPSILAAILIYWGRDTAVATNEEADDPGRTPGRAAVISTVLLLVTYVVTIAAVSYAGIGTKGIGLSNPGNAADVFSAISSTLYGNSVLGKIGLHLLAISILTSASASTQTTILPTARTALSMAVYKAIPTKFARIHPKSLTPTWSAICRSPSTTG